MKIDNWEFTSKREHDGGPIINWLADRAMELSMWLALKAHPYSKVWSITIPDEDES